MSDGESVEPAAASELLQLFDDLPYGFRLRKVSGLQNRHGHAVLRDCNFFTLGNAIHKLREMCFRLVDSDFFHILPSV